MPSFTSAVLVGYPHDMYFRFCKWVSFIITCQIPCIVMHMGIFVVMSMAFMFTFLPYTSSSLFLLFWLDSQSAMYGSGFITCIFCIGVSSLVLGGCLCPNSNHMLV